MSGHKQVRWSFDALALLTGGLVTDPLFGIHSHVCDTRQRSYSLGLHKHLAKAFRRGGLTPASKLTPLDEINHVFSRNLLGVECVESEECLVSHVGHEPVTVGELRLIPEEFLLGADAVYGLYQAPREEIREGPDDLVYFVVQEFEILGKFFHHLLGFFCRRAGLELAIYDFAVLHVRIR